ncbi:hypothetical protein PPERSA_08786 [Pseudocohnilembus persalinus]|uniref:Uncharacterized protein n=1 Tax=Pseudocohnilembus persalinus TaxID=266149 RepID=A0A0V0R7M0_PSEPJ|nr:hypothetical protein PPERSA_08786 [Pseudocohnilembus persalinus]|eukprot:KRX10484.1 hypothetical protein PPERSA_08786 [Pseudocohnilembus persalinus]
MILECYWVQYEEFDNLKQRIKGNLVVCMSYLILVQIYQSVTGNYVYPFMEQFNFFQLLGFYLFFGGVFVFFCWVQDKIIVKLELTYSVKNLEEKIKELKFE